MSSLTRLLPFVWPSRRRLFLSFGFAAAVAILWGANLSVVFPVVKVLLERQSLPEYVQVEIDKAEKEISDYQRDVRKFDFELAQCKDQQKELWLLRNKARSESKLTSASQRLTQFRWIQMYVIPYVPNDQFDTFALIIVLLLGMTLIKLLCMFCEEILVGSVVQLTVMRIRKELFRRTLALDYQTLVRRGTSDLMSRFTYDMETLGNGLSLLGGKVVREPLKALACVSFAFWINWRLTLLSLIFVPLAFVVFHRMGRMLKKASHRSMESMSRIYKILEETFDGLKVVIAFDGGRHHRIHHHRTNKTFFQKSMRIVFIDALTSPATELLGMIAVSIAMLPGAYLVLREVISIWGIRLSTTQMDAAELSVLYAVLAGVIDPVRKLSSVFSKLKKATAAADRVFELMDAHTLVQETTDPVPLATPIKKIDFQNVNFTYSSVHSGVGRPAALESVSLEVAAGEIIAVVGENGSGKSTLVNLLPRYYDPEFGSVQIDGVDLRKFRLRDLRSRIGVVTQETLLFDDTIYENIRYGNPHATRADIERASDQAHVTSFVQQLPEGFNTRVGEKGSALSGGQRQRISLARAILRDPSILILDEATSAVDSQSEYLIHQTLRSFVRGRTTFIITHSVSQSVLDLITRIVIMERGKLIAAGTHEELLRNCPAYGRLFHVQFNAQRAIEKAA